ncbi:MAG: hypothetical protein D6718_02585 [Acidobacteria bacterium]|nr:MAG: hypothetical protein D6718_02585 [Acidobacteriota bacterium]
MRQRVKRARRGGAALVVVFCLATAAWAFREPAHLKRYDGAVKPRAGGAVAIEPVPVESLPPSDPLRAGWERFAAEQGGWTIYLDERTGMPSLASGRGIAWVPGPGNDLPASGPVTIGQLEKLARQFLADHRVLLGDWSGVLQLDREASVQRRPGVWLLVFRQVVDGVRVENARFDFHVAAGNLVAFGTHRWGRPTTDGRPAIDARQARAILDAYLGSDGTTVREEAAPPQLLLLALDPRMEAEPSPWRGARGEGLAHRLVWRLSFRVPGEVPLWVGEIDAHTGELIAFYDAAHYASIRGGVFPQKGDGDCAGGGCDFPHPLPFADVAEDGQAAAFADDFGIYSCSLESAPTTTSLDGQFVRISDDCGPISETNTCGTGLDLGQRAGENCAVAHGASAGNTSAARTAFYDVNRAKQAARAYLPDNTWLSGVLVTNTNVNNTCNASYGGQLNMFRAGNGCGNTGENLGVLVHEWGHGLDENDGGGFDNTSEAYADVVAIFWSHDGCIGPGFFVDGRTCSGYGDKCLSCTGVRDMDYSRRQSGQPATPAGFVDARCGSGGGPCGRETHCESYPISEAIFDLATKDLPAMGLDPASAWQLAEKLWYETRAGSGGDIYTCSLPNSDSCASSSWYQQMRVADDDDGDLANGTPHAAALFAAFDRHGIACGQATDPENQNSGNCPALAAPALAVAPSGSGVQLTWDSVPDAASYTVFRGELGCDKQQVIVGTVTAPETSFFDDNVPSDFIVNYRVRPNAANPACTGPVSNCAVIPEEAKLIESAYRLDESGPNANANGFLEPGETVELPVSLFNYGALDATQVTGTLRALTPASVRVIGPDTTWPDIARNGVQESLAPHFQLTVLPSATCGETLSFGVESQAAEAAPHTDRIDITMGTFQRDYPNNQSQDIPNETQQPVTSTITIDDVRTITDLDVSIDISAFRASDFIIDVTSPSGTTVRLKNRTNGGLNTRYDRDRQPDGPGTMQDFDGEPLQGTWTLSIRDVVPGPFPQGSTLRSWTIHAQVAEPFDCQPFACSDPTPDAVPPSLSVRRSGADLVFDWPAATGATGYNLLADTDAQFPAPALDGRTSGATTLTLAGAASGPAGSVRYYLVRGTNSCNWEGP